MKKKFKKSLSLNTIIGLSVAVIGLVAGLTLVKLPQNPNENAAAATSLFLTPSFQEVNLEKSFTTIVTMDSAENKVLGIDLSISYDPAAIHITEIKPTTELVNFNTVLKNEIDNTNGKLRYASFTFDKTKAISGKLNLLTITGTIPGNAIKANYEIKLNNTSIVLAADESQNALKNISNSEIKIIDGLPNSCGGTCGSNNNCQANYFCFEGFCRNPVCASDTTCTCAVTKTASPRPTVKATTKPIALTTVKPTVKASAAPTVKPNTDKATNGPIIEYKTTEPRVTDDDLQNQVWSEFIKYMLGLLTVVGLGITALVLIKKKKSTITHIMPPTNI